MLILIVVTCCLTTLAFGQNNQKDDAKAPLLSEYFNLEVVDTPKNFKRILRSYPCWQATNFALTSGVDGVYNVETDVYGGPEFPLAECFCV